jgi:hypothetical protein
MLWYFFSYLIRGVTTPPPHPLLVQTFNDDIRLGLVLFNFSTRWIQAGAICMAMRAAAHLAGRWMERCNGGNPSYHHAPEIANELKINRSEKVRVKF